MLFKPATHVASKLKPRYTRFQMPKARLRFGSVYQRKKKLPNGTMTTLAVWWIKYRKGAQIVRESTGTRNRTDAETPAEGRLGEIATGRFVGIQPERTRFSELAEAVVQDYAENNRISMADLRSRLRLHILPAVGSLHAAEFGSAHVRRYIDSRRKAGASKSRPWRKITCAKASWITSNIRGCLENFRMRSNPCSWSPITQARVSANCGRSRGLRSTLRTTRSGWILGRPRTRKAEPYRSTGKSRLAGDRKGAS